MVEFLTTCDLIEERLAALHQASLQLVQNISLDSLLKQIVQIAREQGRARYAALGVLDQDGKISQFLPVGTPDSLNETISPPRGLGILGELMQTREAIRLTDLTKDPRHLGFPNTHPVMHSFLGVPIWHGEHQVGVIYLTDKENGAAFTIEDQQVIETLAAYAAVAISNARLYSQLIQRDRTLTRRNENLGLLNELASTLASLTDINHILEKILTGVMDYLRLEVGEVFLCQEDSSTLKLAYHRGSTISNLWKRSSYPFGRGMIGMAASTGLPQLASLPGPAENELDSGALQAKLTQVACFPLSGHSGVLGVLILVNSNSRPIDELELQFLSTISLWLGTVIENVRLNLQQRRLAVLEERERIGMDLHDGVIQSIYAVGLTLENARMVMDENPKIVHERIKQAIDGLNNTIRDIRTYILDLRPRQLHDENLIEGVQRLVNEFRANTFIEVNLQGAKDHFMDLSEEKSVILFHICQEALANIAKHARARHVNVTVWTAGGRALLEVADDGRGFNMNKVKTNLGHGLSNMVTRARNIGGDVEFSSEPDEGTTVLAWVPFIKEE